MDTLRALLFCRSGGSPARRGVLTYGKTRVETEKLPQRHGREVSVNRLRAGHYVRHHEICRVVIAN
jgi:hypothetical protein